MYVKMMKSVFFLFCFVAIGIEGCFAQAIFTAGSTPAVAADIGCTELAGSINLTVIAGATAASPFLITYSAPITNNDVSEISVIGTGGLNASSVLLDRDRNSLLVNVPAGGTTGNSIAISGVRVAIAGLNLSQVTASILSVDAGGNAFLSGQTNLVVISNVMQPFEMDQSAPPLSYSSSGFQSVTTFRIVEKYTQALIGSGAGRGRIRITPFPFIPHGAQVTLAATAVSISSGAVFRTLSGNPEVIPREDGSTEVVYDFFEGPESPYQVEDFEFDASISQIQFTDSDGNVHYENVTGSGTVQFQAELLPIGLAVPNNQFPSTEIPRYAERLVPDESELVTGSTELFFPFGRLNDDTYTGIALTNPHGYSVRATLTAYDEAGVAIAGTGITNPVQIELPRNGQYAKLASQIFGDTFNASSRGTIRVIGRAPILPGFYLTGDNSGPKLDGSIGNIQGMFSWYLPVLFRQGPSPFNSLELFNPGVSDVTVSLRLMDTNGNQIAARNKTIVAGGTTFNDFREIFNIDQSSFQGGYIRGDSELPLIVREQFGNSLESNVLAVQPALSLPSFSIPQFASGGQYSTELTLVNTNLSFLADITLTPFNDSGVRISDSVNVQIRPGAQLIRTVADLFPNLGDGLVTGSIKVEVKPTQFGPFTSVPAILGAVRFANVDGSASTTLPLIITPSDDFVYSQLAQNQDWFTGVAVLNSNTTPASVTVDVYGSDGVLTGTYSSELQPAERFAKLIYQLVPASAGQGGGYIRISSDAPLTSFAIFGTNNLKSLSAIPPVDVP